MDRVIHREENGSLIKGTIINLLVNDDGYHLVDLKVYADGYMDCLGEIDLPTIKKLFESGKLCWKMPPNEKLFIPYISYIWTSDYENRKESDEFILNLIESKIEELKNEENHQSKCIEAFRHYLINPIDPNLKKLKNIYDLLPVEKRALFEHTPKDPLIKLMETQEHISRKDREYYLKDYFEGEWLEIK
jgi:hypothetical protein